MGRQRVCAPEGRAGAFRLAGRTVQSPRQLSGRNRQRGPGVGRERQGCGEVNRPRTPDGQPDLHIHLAGLAARSLAVQQPARPLTFGRSVWRRPRANRLRETQSVESGRRPGGALDGGQGVFQQGGIRPARETDARGTDERCPPRPGREERGPRACTSPCAVPGCPFPHRCQQGRMESCTPRERRPVGGTHDRATAVVKPR